MGLFAMGSHRLTDPCRPSALLFIKGDLSAVRIYIIIYTGVKVNTLFGFFLVFLRNRNDFFAILRFFVMLF